MSEEKKIEQPETLLDPKIRKLKKEIYEEMQKNVENNTKDNFYLTATYQAFMRDVVFEIQYLRGKYGDDEFYSIPVNLFGVVYKWNKPFEGNYIYRHYEYYIDTYIENLGIKLFSYETKRMIVSAVNLILGGRKVEEVWNELLGFLVAIYNLEKGYNSYDGFMFGVTHKEQRKR